MRRGVDARLADLEVQHLAALRLERAGAGQHLEGGLGAEAGECVCERRGQGAKVIGGPELSTSGCAASCRVRARGVSLIELIDGAESGAS